jgi:hypothetical protein
LFLAIVALKKARSLTSCFFFAAQCSQHIQQLRLYNTLLVTLIVSIGQLREEREQKPNLESEDRHGVLHQVQWQLVSAFCGSE